VWDATNKFKEEIIGAGQTISPALSGLIAFGVGFFFFFISLVPEHLQFIVKLLGFQGDRTKATEVLSKQKKSCLFCFSDLFVVVLVVDGVEGLRVVGQECRERADLVYLALLVSGRARDGGRGAGTAQENASKQSHHSSRKRMGRARHR
jgi:hypothetical protein